MSLLLYVRVAATSKLHVLKLQSKVTDVLLDVEHAVMPDNVSHLSCFMQVLHETMQIL